MSGEELAARIRAVLAIDPGADAVEFRGTWWSWSAIGAVAEGVVAELDQLGAEPAASIGVVLRNSPTLIGAVLGVLLADRCIVTINASQGTEALARDVADLATPVIVASSDEWARPGVLEAARSTGAAGVAVDGGSSVVPELGSIGAGPHRPPRPGVAVEMLTSGTTGPPKRVALSYESFARTVAVAGSHYRRGGGRESAPGLRTGVAIVSSPLVHMSGLFRTLLNVCEGRRIALMDRFTADEFLELVARHRPKAVSLVPAALRMVLDAEPDPAVFADVEVVTSGTAALSADLQEAFEQQFGVAVLPSYGATEFAGGVAGWTLPMHREWSSRKRGSVGRPQPGRSVRAVDPDGRAVGPGEQGRIEVRTGEDAWVPTTDIGRVDADGFVWIDGRSDDVIIRGGFKINPADVVAALRTHPAVLDAGVVGVEDERLGAVPVAAVELRAGQQATDAELLAHVRGVLAPYQVPVQVRIVETLPRTPSLKVSQPQVRALFDGGVPA